MGNRTILRQQKQINRICRDRGNSSNMMRGQRRNDKGGTPTGKRTTNQTPSRQKSRVKRGKGLGGKGLRTGQNIKSRDTKTRITPKGKEKDPTTRRNSETPNPLDKKRRNFKTKINDRKTTSRCRLNNNSTRNQIAFALPKKTQKPIYKARKKPKGGHELGRQCTKP